jgi:hypothetical protein
MIPSLPLHLPRSLSQAPSAAALEERLFSAVERVLHEWARLTPRKSGQGLDSPATYPMHATVRMEGSQAGLLVVSGQERVGAMLAVAATSEADARSFATEALLELCQRLREALFSPAAGPESHEPLWPSVRWTHREELPRHAPSAALRLQVNGYPLEIRLWHP